jgi:hypothetical protein
MRLLAPVMGSEVGFRGLDPVRLKTWPQFAS